MDESRAGTQRPSVANACLLEECAPSRQIWIGSRRIAERRGNPSRFITSSLSEQGHDQEHLEPEPNDRSILGHEIYIFVETSARLLFCRRKIVQFKKSGAVQETRKRI